MFFHTINTSKSLKTKMYLLDNTELDRIKPNYKKYIFLNCLHTHFFKCVNFIHSTHPFKKKTTNYYLPRDKLLCSVSYSHLYILGLCTPAVYSPNLETLKFRLLFKARQT